MDANLKTLLLPNPLKKALALEIRRALGSSQSLEAIYEQITLPPTKELGHYAFPCFILAKTLKKAPPLIAKELAQQIPLSNLILRLEAAGPYINFEIAGGVTGAMLLPELLNGRFFQLSLPVEVKKRIMVEYSQPNTHKEIHVGHMRNLALGQALSRILRYVGHEVLTATYPGDVGTHVAKCLWYLQTKNPPIPAEGRGVFLGQIYAKAHQLLEEERGTSCEEKNRQQLTQILQEIHAQSGPAYDLWLQTRQWSIQLMKSVYEWCGAEFDHWFFESEMDAPSVKRIKSAFQQGKLIESQGAIGMDLSDEKLGFCMLLKSDGNGLYSTKDVELAIRKFEQFKVQKNLYIVDVRQSLHFKQVFRVLEHLGYPLAKDCHHLAYDFVELPEGAMSSRLGNIVPITDLMNEMQTMITDRYLNRYDDWSAEKVQNTAHLVALSAIFFGMLRIDPQKKIVFQMEEWLKLDGESGPYLLYVNARIQSLLRKINFDPQHCQEYPILYSSLVHPVEQELILKMAELNEVAIEASLERPSHLCNYLYDLCKIFNHFYLECPIARAESEELKWTRAALAYATSRVLQKGIELLGFQPVDEM